MENVSRHVAIIAGPNGAGKSTCGPDLLKKHFAISELVNADIIASGLSALQPETVAIEASRLMLGRIKFLAENGQNFAFETTLASRTFFPWLKRLKQQHYEVILVYFWLPSADLAIERVAERVRSGGHSVPEETVKRRYYNSIRNFFSLYQPIADNWAIFDNSEKERPLIIAEGNTLYNVTVRRQKQWESMQRMNYETR